MPLHYTNYYSHVAAFPRLQAQKISVMSQLDTALIQSVEIQEVNQC